MKKYLMTFFVTLAISFLALNLNLKAQNGTPPCDMDCLPMSPWIPASLGPYSVPGCPSCSLSFNYWYRPAACGVWHDVQLGQITLTLGCSFCPLSVKDYVDLAIDKMIRYNPIPKPGKDTCQTFWRAVNGSCWGFLHMGNDTVIEPCQPSECCWRTMRVCGVGNDSITYTFNPGYSPSDICWVYLWPCTFVCEEVPEPPVMPTGLKENINAESGFKTTVYPNPSNDWVNIRLVSESEGEHNVEIFDAAGNLIISKNFSKRQSEIFIQLNMSNYVTGNYRYVIKQNGKPGINGSFNVVK